MNIRRMRVLTIGALVNYFVLALVLILVLASCGGTSSPTSKAQKPTAAPQPKPPTVFVLSSQGSLASYQASGKLLWQTASSSSHQIAGSIGMGKPGNNLLVNEGSIYIGNNSVQAYNRQEGHLLWSHDLPDATEDMLLAGQTLYIESSTITAWDKDHGTLLWQQSDPNLVGGPMISNDHLLFVSGLAQTAAIDQQTGRVVWRQDTDPGDSVQGMNLSGDGTVLLLQTGTKLQAFNAKTGKLIWQRNSQPLALYLDTETNTLYTTSIDVPDPSMSGSSQIWSGLRAVDLMTGKTLWSAPLNLGLSDTSTISSTGIIVATATTVTSWELSGKQAWQIPYVGQPVAQIESGSSASGLTFLLTQAGGLLALNTSNGQQRWQTTVMTGPNFNIHFQQDLLWLNNPSNGAISAMTLQGTIRWSMNTGNTFIAQVIEPA